MSRALSAVVDMGVMLRCNVVVHEGDDGKATVVAVDPMQALAAAEPELASVAGEVQARLKRVVEKLA